MVAVLATVALATAAPYPSDRYTSYVEKPAAGQAVRVFEHLTCDDFTLQSPCSCDGIFIMAASVRIMDCKSAEESLTMAADDQARLSVDITPSSMCSLLITATTFSGDASLRVFAEAVSLVIYSWTRVPTENREIYYHFEDEYDTFNRPTYFDPSTGHFMTISTEKDNWFTAQTACAASEKWGQVGYLPTLESQDEFKVLHSALVDADLSAGNGDVWLGLSQLNTALGGGGWRWATGPGACIDLDASGYQRTSCYTGSLSSTCYSFSAPPCFQMTFATTVSYRNWDTGVNMMRPFAILSSDRFFRWVPVNAPATAHIACEYGGVGNALCFNELTDGLVGRGGILADSIDECAFSLTSTARCAGAGTVCSDDSPTALGDWRCAPTPAPPTLAPATPTPPTPVPPSPAPPTPAPATATPPTPVPPSPAPSTLAPATATPPTPVPSTPTPPTSAPATPTPLLTPTHQTRSPVNTSTGPDMNSTAAPDYKNSEKWSEAAQARLENAGVVASMVGLVGGAGAGRAVSLGVMRNIGCEVSDVDIAFDEPLDYEFHIVGNVIGTSHSRYLIAGVVMNHALFGGFIVLVLMASWCLARRLGGGFVEGRAGMKAPGLFVVPLAFFLPGTSLIAARLVFFPKTTGAAAATLGGFALATTLVAPLLMYWYVIRRVPVKAYTVKDPLLHPRPEGMPVVATRGGRLGKAVLPHGPKRRIYQWAFGDVIWVSAGRGYFCDTQGIIFDSYRPDHAYMLVYEMLTHVVFSFFAAWLPANNTECHTRNAIISLLSVWFAVTMYRAKPFLAPLDNFFGIALSMMQATAMVLMTVGIMADATRDAVLFHLAEMILLVCAGTIVVKGLWDLCTRLLDIYWERRYTMRVEARIRDWEHGADTYDMTMLDSAPVNNAGQLELSDMQLQRLEPKQSHSDESALAASALLGPVSEKASCRDPDDDDVDVSFTRMRISDRSPYVATADPSISVASLSLDPSRSRHHRVASLTSKTARQMIGPPKSRKCVECVESPPGSPFTEPLAYSDHNHSRKSLDTSLRVISSIRTPQEEPMNGVRAVQSVSLARSVRRIKQGRGPVRGIAEEPLLARSTSGTPSTSPATHPAPPPRLVMSLRHRAWSPGRDKAGMKAMSTPAKRNPFHSNGDDTEEDASDQGLRIRPTLSVVGRRRASGQTDDESATDIGSPSVALLNTSQQFSQSTSEMNDTHRSLSHVDNRMLSHHGRRSGLRRTSVDVEPQPREASPQKKRPRAVASVLSGNRNA
eukprot:TRINITY_DN4301_c0_g1_i3.p1 TRINITY_DN4301_c0_g1~~TRINITY_DN4301_c0_g1_i3.p1  ORF type:complete len:1256 (+),score=100.89 TRINITY_DN4301_c0_g1_i3:72-3839(+)